MKYLIFTICGLGLVMSLSAQNDAGLVVDSKTTEGNTTGGVIDRKVKAKNNITADESELLNITGISGSVFTASNTADGTEKSYNHNLRIVISLNLAENKTEKYQLVFYSNVDRIPFAVASEISAFSVYYPLSMYESIKAKLEQAVAAKKKVQLRVVRKTDGYREGTLIF